MFEDTRDILVIAQDELNVLNQMGRETSLRLIDEIKRLRCEVEALSTPSERELALKAQAVSELKFPVMLRRMWSGAEVQEWLAEQSDGILYGHAAL